MAYAKINPVLEIDIWRLHGPSKPQKGNYAVCLSSFGYSSVIREFKTRKEALKFRAKCSKKCRKIEIRAYFKEEDAPPKPLIEMLRDL